MSRFHLNDRIDAPHGQFLLKVYRRGILIETVNEPNLIVTGSKEALAHLLGGDVATRSVTQIGFGTSGTSPVIGNTSLTSGFYKDLDGVAYPSAGTVDFEFSLSSSEANGMAIMEFGLLTEGDVLFSRRVRSAALNKESDISLTGLWSIVF